MTKSLAILSLLLLPTVTLAQRTGLSAREYKSPDQALVAVITSTKAPEATQESKVVLRSKSGQLLTMKDYSSPDGEHGYGVTKAMWTPDSQFFVYSLESSGGHQAWNSPVWFFSRTSGKVLSLDNALDDAVANPTFTIGAPDKVTVELFFSKKKRTVSLSALKRGH